MFHGDGHEFFEGLDAGVVEGVGAEELGLMGAMYSVVTLEPAPQFDREAGVVACLGHVDGTDAVAFVFLFP